MNMSISSDSSSLSSPAAALDWKFSQVFGDRLPGEDVQDIDIISAIEFDKNGDHLAVGDRGGRVVIFQDDGGKDDIEEFTPRNELEQLDTAVSRHPKFQYKTEFQSHESEFDYLRSVEIEEKINKVRWCAASNGSLHILSSNDKTVKLWKVKDRKVKQVKEMDISPSISSESSLLAEKSFINGQKSYFANGHSLEGTGNLENGASHNGVHNKIAFSEDASISRCRRVYAHAHDFSINSISVNSDWETFLSGDDLRINLWNLEVSDQCFNVIDLKPVNMEDLIGFLWSFETRSNTPSSSHFPPKQSSLRPNVPEFLSLYSRNSVKKICSRKEVITTTEFHPFHCNLLAYSSSRGFIRLVDMRQSALCDHSAIILKDEDANGQKSFFTEIIASITDMKFAYDGRHILSRDFMNLKLWDMHMDSGPVATIKIHENLRPKLADLYNNDAIFDKFDCCLAKDRLTFATGSYSNILRVFPYGSGNEGATIEASRNPNRKPLGQTTSRTRRSSLSNLARGFYRQGQDSHGAGSNEFSYDFNSKLLHLAWHPTTNLIACAAGNSLLMYHA